MNEPTNVQTIMQDGKPAFVVIPSGVISPSTSLAESNVKKSLS